MPKGAHTFRPETQLHPLSLLVRLNHYHLYPTFIYLRTLLCHSNYLDSCFTNLNSTRLFTPSSIFMHSPLRVSEYISQNQSLFILLITSSPGSRHVTSLLTNYSLFRHSNYLELCSTNLIFTRLFTPSSTSVRSSLRVSELISQNQSLFILLCPLLINNQ